MCQSRAHGAQGSSQQDVHCYRVLLCFISAEDLAKEPPIGRFPDWLNLRVQRPKAAAAARLRAEKQKRGKPKKEATKADLLDAQTFEVSE